MGIFEMAGPKIIMIAAREIKPATTPRKADFQSLAVPAARTIVVASTASTAHARKTEIKSARALAVIDSTLVERLSIIFSFKGTWSSHEQSTNALDWPSDWLRCDLYYDCHYS